MWQVDGLRISRDPNHQLDALQSVVDWRGSMSSEVTLMHKVVNVCFSNG